jgi:8-oxo-dGTP diphosphatase
MKDVTAALIIKDEKILICKRSKNDKQGGKWEFPGGKIEAGETQKECLKREIKEELDLNIKVNDKIGENIYEYPGGSIKLIAFYADLLDGDLKLNVHDDYKWVTRDKLKEFDFTPADIFFLNILEK